MGRPKKEQTGDFDVQELNKGVDFMEKNNITENDERVFIITTKSSKHYADFKFNN